MRMHLHEHDENSAPNQSKELKPTDPDAHLAHGIDGAQPPLEPEGAEDGRRHTPEVFAAHPISDLLKRRDVELEALGRLTHPVVRRRGSDVYEPIAWPEAFDLIGRELRALDSPDQASFYTSGRASNEAAFLYG